MDLTTRLNLSYPAAQPLPSAPAATDKPAVASAHVVSESAPAAKPAHEGKASKDRDAEKESKDLKAAVQEMEQFFQSVRRNLEFSIDDGSGQVVVKVIATETGELIRQLPSAEALKIAGNLREASSLFDAKV